MNRALNYAFLGLACGFAGVACATDRPADSAYEPSQETAATNTTAASDATANDAALTPASRTTDNDSAAYHSDSHSSGSTSTGSGSTASGSTASGSTASGSTASGSTAGGSQPSTGNAGTGSAAAAGNTNDNRDVNRDNTKVNERDRNDANLTPGDQQENSSDLKITQQIRQAVMADDTLSFGAKNVKIITANGKVTLRGTVKTAAERTSIEAAAKKVAGVSSVENQIEVKK